MTHPRPEYGGGVNQLIDAADASGSMYPSNSRISPNRMSRSRFSPDNAVGRGTLAGVLGRAGAASR